MFDAGTVTILQGLPATGGPTTGGITVLGATGLTENDTFMVPQMLDRFGAVLAVGDFDGDGADDLAVGTPQEDVVGNVPSFTFVQDGGFVAVFSHATTLHGIYTQLPLGLNPQAFDRFGAALAAADFNGDGADDLAMGTPGDAVGGVAGAGSVTVLFGILNLGLPRPATFGLRSDYRHRSDLHPGDDRYQRQPGGGRSFRRSLSAGDVGRTAHADLIIGVPDEDLLVVLGGDLDGLITETRANAGGVHVLFGSTAILTGAGSQFVTQNSAGVPESVDAGDRFGLALP